MSALPVVSVIVPCRNEVTHIEGTLKALANQDYPSERLEIIVVDGRSEDGTRELIEHIAAKSRVGVRLLDNPAVRTPQALNIGVREARGELVMLMGAHSEPSSAYISDCVATMESSGATCVGGILETVGTTPAARAIAAAQRSFFGVGNARFRTGASKAGPVDTVAFAAYRRSVFAEVGLFAEDLPRNQDDEFNFRLIQAGHTVWLDPEARAVYYSRADLGKLWRQYFEYGLYKVRVIQKLGAVPSLRQLVPPTFVLALLVASGAATVGRRPKPLAVLAGGYIGAAVVATRLTGQASPLVTASFATMHISYGLGFLWGLWRWRWAPPESPPRLDLAHGNDSWSS